MKFRQHPPAFSLVQIFFLTPRSHMYAPLAYVVRPASDDFALVPRVFSDRFFSAVSTFYACDESSAWPPGESWWNPHCDGKGFGETVLFRHLHALEVDYRTYPMFDYVPTLHEKSGKNCDTRESAYYTSACILLGTWGLLPASFSG